MAETQLAEQKQGACPEESAGHGLTVATGHQRNERNNARKRDRRYNQVQSSAQPGDLA